MHPKKKLDEPYASHKLLFWGGKSIITWASGFWLNKLNARETCLGTGVGVTSEMTVSNAGPETRDRLGFAAKGSVDSGDDRYTLKNKIFNKAQNNICTWD